jgi:hypothetical protein
MRRFLEHPFIVIRLDHLFADAHQKCLAMLETVSDSGA